MPKPSNFYLLDIRAQQVNKIASFTYPPDFVIDLIQGNALEIKADVAIFGRCKKLKRHLEAVAGCPFEPFVKPWKGRRKISILRHAKLPWPTAISVDYAPRNVATEVRRTAKGYWPRKPTHTAGLFLNLWQILFKIHEELAAERVLLLPLSWRNPDVVSIATAGAIWKHCNSIATSFAFVRQPRDRFLERLMQLCDPRTEAEKAEEERKILAIRRAALQETKYIKHFIFADLKDPSPLIASMTNHENRLVAALRPEVNKASWKLAPFTRATD